MIVDLSVNIAGKDGAPLDPSALLNGAKSAGLDGLVLTQEGGLPDIGGFRSAGDSLGLKVFAGAKIPTNQGLILCLLPNPGDVLPAGFASQVDGFYEANEVIDAVEAKGGVTIALRPYDRGLPRPMGDHLFSLQGLSACEVQNGRVDQNCNDLALEAASHLEMPCVGTSCAEGLEGLGTAATLFRTPVTSEADLCEAIRSGDCWPITFSSDLPEMSPEEDRGGRGGERREGGDGGRRRGRRGGRRRSGGERAGNERPANERPANERAANDRAGNERGPGGGEAREAREPAGPRSGGRGPGGGGRFGGGRPGGAPGGRSDDRGNSAGRGRRRGGRGRGRGEPRSDDFGNRAAPSSRGPVDDNVGNYDPSAGRETDENIGNRLRPGERPLFQRVVVDFSEDEDDNVGNR